MPLNVHRGIVSWQDGRVWCYAGSSPDICDDESKPSCHGHWGLYFLGALFFVRATVCLPAADMLGKQLMLLMATIATHLAVALYDNTLAFLSSDTELHNPVQFSAKLCSEHIALVCLVSLVCHSASNVGRQRKAWRGCWASTSLWWIPSLGSRAHLRPLQKDPWFR